ncbi:MAG: NADPH-dependent F420 reductase [Spirochaetaceae bacterium]|nr:NADPH-dependent F420 reductase [Spirochaetaceae bacterium]|tara:strand:+ start:37940 stop:38548 length:609 start_codon:yes stop_codon:yes gene_type:complete
MNIAIIGKGNVGTALAAGLIAAGHRVIFGVRNPDKPNGTPLQGAEYMGLLDAMKEARIIILATPPTAAPAVAGLFQGLAESSEKTLIDTTNSLFQKPEMYASAYQALEQITGRSVVKCFNSTGAENMANPRYESGAIPMFFCGGSETDKALTRQLCEDLGFSESYDLGGPEAAPMLEQFAGLWIRLSRQGMGRQFAFQLVRR